MKDELENLMSYKSIQNSLRNFRSFRRDDFNLYDEPGTYWFKPIFYFYKSGADSIDADINNEGLLHPSWLTERSAADWGDGANSDQESVRKKVVENKFVSSAYNYLKRNAEDERAALLQRFIELLSNIASRSPWYFQEVSGLDNAIDHSENFKTGKFVSDDRKQITFTLLPDAIDDRIGTLMDLYRSICYDWIQKREVIPSNLRKFDMGLYIFGSMIQDKNSDILHSRTNLSGALRAADKLGLGYDPKKEIVNAAGDMPYSVGTAIGQTETEVQGINTTMPKVYPISYMSKGQSHVYLEFINCEINLSSTKGGDTISNADGAERKYTLTIEYDDCYVNRYNNFILGAIGDVISNDVEKGFYGANCDATLGRPTNSDGILANMVNGAKDMVISSTLGAVQQAIQNAVGNILLGNLYTGSLVNSAALLTSGRLDAVGGAVRDLTNPNNYKKSATQAKESLYNAAGQNLTQVQQNINNKTIYTPVANKTKVKALGSLYRSAGAAANL